MRKLFCFLSIFAIILASNLYAGKGKTTLSKGYARDSATTVTRFTVDQIVINSDSTLTVLLNNGDVTLQIYQDSLPVKVRQGLQKINSDLKMILER